MNLKVKDLPISERPYEKCLAYGPGALSDAELLAALLRTGTAGKNSMELAREILQHCGPDMSIAGLDRLTDKELRSIKGVGDVKFVQLKCFTEFSRRLWRARRGNKPSFCQPKEVAEYYMEELRHLEREEMRVLMLDARLSFLGDSLMSIGTVNSAMAIPREIFVEALRKDAVGLMLVHNHPSGDPTPSMADIKTTERIREAGELIGIKVLDAIIIGDGIYVSFREKGILKWESS